MIKKIIFLAAIATALSATSYAGTITDAASVSLGDSGITFAVSSKVKINTSGSTTAYTLVAKHTAGGTTGYASTETATGIATKKGMGKNDDPDNAGTAGDMPTGYNL